MTLVFVGPPYSGKGTQVKLLSEKFKIPVFSMGALLREGNRVGNPKAVEGYQNYVIKGLHAPNALKFELLKEKIEQNKSGFILDNYPANKEDLETLLNYLKENSLTIDKVFHLYISVIEMKKRMVHRDRDDDKPETVLIRRKVQDADRLPVLEHFRKSGILWEINGEGSIEEVNKRIMEVLDDKN